MYKKATELDENRPEYLKNRDELDESKALLDVDRLEYHEFRPELYKKAMELDENRPEYPKNRLELDKKATELHKN
ncbi:hypothetical protein KMW28_12945 [Flammeovirga yaeyamensis]|uniref:Uncharacterized protein n=1 Tax=Flammeovirga yaeyamensis TaxID=367791 RepID=A0AAX1MZ94_9BACT|nr:hypothetical protein [Flammeovirga yaeyamensis]MBB3695922.1 transcription termination factor Rho [Flammeovirga yaeyamensis]NMF34611.1 hypothetical protein [Flammeovirga yaeyamensis]QWG00559.1 hypothetical protein KMW28_12945 [Flammeovirga yaeyamensis]